MGNNFNISPDQMDSLMQMASQKMDGLMQNLTPGQQAQINNLMNNPAAIEKLIASPKVQMLLKGLMGK